MSLRVMARWLYVELPVAGCQLPVLRSIYENEERYLGLVRYLGLKH
jgi:hypothetical protein